MRAIIIEDEKLNLELMKIIISRNKHLEIIGEFTNSKEALENILKLSPDVIFVDIEMPYMNGIELAKEVMNFNSNIQIVFVTAYEKYALDAFEVNAVNYILKPISESALNVTVNRLLKNYNLVNNSSEEDRRNEIFSLGCFEVYGNIGSEAVKWPTAKVQEMFAYFLYEGGNDVDKWKLCDILWPDSPPKKAEHNLHSAIYRLKTAFKNAGIQNVVNYKMGKYRIDLKRFYCDAFEFETFIEKNPEVNGENISNYERVMKLYKGTLFGNEDYVWAIELNEKLDRYYLDRMKNIAEYYMEIKFYSKAEEYLKKVTKKDPFDEEAHELMLKTYFNMGDRTGLVSYYNEFNRVLKDELDIEPKESTHKLYKNLLSKLAEN